MRNSNNEKLQFLVKLGKQDCRTLIGKNIRVICDKWRVCERQLWNERKNACFCIFSEAKMMECEHTVQMVKDLTNGIIGFNDDEVKGILNYITTT